MKRDMSSTKPYITKDGSLIYEVFNPGNSQVKNLSVAIAEIPPNSSTKLHRHENFEEVYYIIEGNGIIFVERDRYEVKKGDLVYIPIKASHKAMAKNEPLKILCICSPPYSHEDTSILEDR